MKINHMNMTVPDVEATATFFEKHFAFTIRKQTGGVIAILEDEDGFVLVLSNFPKTATFDYPADFHIGFYRDTKEDVITVFNRLKAVAVELPPEPKEIRDRFGFYFRAPGGLLIEITCANG